MAHVSTSKSYLIEPLDGDNYYNWKFRMSLILAENGVEHCIKAEVNLDSIQDQQEKEKEMKNDRKAMSLIVQCVKDNQLESLREKKTAYSMWTTLEQKHEKKGLPGQLYLKKKMMLMKLNEGEELAGFLNKFDKIVRQLKATGVVVDEKDIICNLLLTLPKSFETVVTIIENLPPDKLEYEDVKKKLLADEEKRCLGKKKTIIATDQTAFNTEIVCFRCGRLREIIGQITKTIVQLIIKIQEIPDHFATIEVFNITEAEILMEPVDFVEEVIEDFQEVFGETSFEVRLNVNNIQGEVI